MSGKTGQRATGRKPVSSTRTNVMTAGAFGKEGPQQVRSQTELNRDRTAQRKRGTGYGVIPMPEPYGLEDQSYGEPEVSIDPVCGMQVVEEDAAAKIGYAGQMYYFCSPECREKFTDEPGRYAGRQR